MDGPVPLFLQKLNAQIEDLEITVEKLEVHLSSTHMPDADRKLFARLLATTKKHLFVMYKNRATLAESYAILDGCHDQQHALFRLETAANPPTSLHPRTMVAVDASPSHSTARTK